MAAKICMIKDVTEGMSGWVVEALVLEKSTVKTTPGQSTYQKIVLVDIEGTKVQCILWNSDIQILKDTLKPFHTYSISNARVDQTKPEYRVFNNPLQWQLTARTPIEEVAVPGLNTRNLKFNFTPLSDLGAGANDSEGIDILCAILRVGLKRRTNDLVLQNITVVDQGKIPTTLVLWNQFTENEGESMSKLEDPYPILLATRLKINNFNGLSTRGSTIFCFNPPIPEAEKLRAWCVKNSRVINKLPMPDQNAGSTPTKNDTPQKKDIIKIAQLPDTVPKVEFYWVRAECKVVDFSQKLWYASCSKCSNATDATSASDFRCNHCKERVLPIANLRFNIELSDDSGSIDATVYPREAGAMFGVTAEYVQENTNQAEPSSEIIDKLGGGVQYVVRVKAYNYGNRQQGKCSYSVYEYESMDNIGGDDHVDGEHASVGSADGSSRKRKPRKKLFVEIPPRSALDGEDLPIAVAFGKKRRSGTS